MADLIKYLWLARSRRLAAFLPTVTSKARLSPSEPNCQFTGPDWLAAHTVIAEDGHLSKLRLELKLTTVSNFA